LHLVTGYTQIHTLQLLCTVSSMHHCSPPSHYNSTALTCSSMCVRQ
jgi:hypothetical protein